MSDKKLTHFFRFPRVKISEIGVSDDRSLTLVKLEPDRRYLPICSGCGRKLRQVHSWEVRQIYDLPMSESMVVINLRYRKVRCPDCGIRVEHHDFVSPYARHTHRLAQLVLTLCEQMPISKVAELLKLSWDQVKHIDKTELKKQFDDLDLSNVEFLMIDEISFKKHHHYLTIIANFKTGEVIGVIKDRNYEAVSKFLENLPLDVRNNIKAVAVDMWDPYIKAVKNHLPNAAIVFDFFHVTAAFSRVIDQVRRAEFKQADPELKQIIKGARYILLKNAHHLKDKERPKLKKILQTNQRLNTVYILKDYLKRLWQYSRKAWAEKFLNYWCQLAIDSGIKPLKTFANQLKRYSYGILNHCQYKIHTSKIEGINNKIKVIKRKAYGYRDLEYFELKIKQATCN